MSIFSPAKKKPDAYELAELDRLAGIVDRHIRDYAQVGAALREIRDRQLFRMTHETFEAFINARWSMERAHAYRLIAAAEVAATVSPTGSVPRTERQARPLTTLPPEQQTAAWTSALELAGDEEPATNHVEVAVDQIRPRRKKKSRRAKALRLRVPGAIVIVQPGRGFETFELALQQALTKLADVKRAA